MKYKEIKQAENFYKRILIEDFNRYLAEENKVKFYKIQNYYKNLSLDIL